MEDDLKEQLHTTLSAALKAPGFEVVYLRPGILSLTTNDEKNTQYVLKASVDQILSNPLSVLLGIQEMFKHAADGTAPEGTN